MAVRRILTINIIELFHQITLTANYNADLKEAIEAAFGEYTNNMHQFKDASLDVRNLACSIAVSGSITKKLNG